MREKHIQVGDYGKFTESMTQIGVEKRKVPQQNAIGSEIYGLKIIENKYIPKDRALLVDENGKVIQIYDL
jgi:hypothetical protein